MIQHQLTPSQLSILYGQHKLYNETHYGIISFRTFCKQEYNGIFTSYNDGTIYFDNESYYTLFLMKL